MARKPADIVQPSLRIRDDLRRRLEQAAKKRGVSLNFEMTNRLKESFDREAHRTIDVVIGRGSTNFMQCTMFGTCAYRQTGLVQAFAAHHLLLAPPRKVGFASPCEAFGHRELLHALESHGLSRAKMVA